MPTSTITTNVFHKLIPELKKIGDFEAENIKKDWTELTKDQQDRFVSSAKEAIKAVDNRNIIQKAWHNITKPFKWIYNETKAFIKFFKKTEGKATEEKGQT